MMGLELTSDKYLSIMSHTSQALPHLPLLNIEIQDDYRSLFIGTLVMYSEVEILLFV